MTAAVASAAVTPLETAKILIDESGLYEISAQELADVLNQPLSEVQQQLRKKKVRLSHRDGRVRWEPVGDGDGLRFYAQALAEIEDNHYSDTNVYWLKLGTAGQTMASCVGARLSGPNRSIPSIRRRCGVMTTSGSSPTCSMTRMRTSGYGASSPPERLIR